MYDARRGLEIKERSCTRRAARAAGPECHVSWPVQSSQRDSRRWLETGLLPALAPLDDGWLQPAPPATKRNPYGVGSHDHGQLPPGLGRGRRLSVGGLSQLVTWVRYLTLISRVGTLSTGVTCLLPSSSARRASVISISLLAASAFVMRSIDPRTAGRTDRPSGATT